MHPSGRWVAVPLVVGLDERVLAVLDTGAPQSAVSPRIEARLLDLGLLGPSPIPRRYRLAGLTAQGRELPEIEVGVIRRLDLIGVDGLLGLDFLRKFRRLHFDMHTLVLTLERE